MTPVRPLDEVFLGANAVIFGLLTASVASRISGALAWFEPVQPIVGAIGVGLAVSALVVDRRRAPASRSDDLVAR